MSADICISISNVQPRVHPSQTERFREYLQNLPSCGIGVQGTTLSNAEKIQKQGLTVVSKNPQHANWFYHFQPKIAASNPSGVIPALREATMNTWVYADMRRRYRDEQGKSALVVFIPSKIPHRDHGDENEIVYDASETSKISSRQVLGTFQVPQLPVEYHPSDKTFYQQHINREGKKGKQEVDKILLEIKRIVDEHENKPGNFQNRFLSRLLNLLRIK